MKKLLQLTVCVVLLLISMPMDADAQYGGKKKKKKTKTEQTDDYFDEKGNIAARMWYGGSIRNIGLFNNVFTASISPMAGYKITDQFSAGIITKLDYYYERIQFSSLKIERLDYSVGAFTRYRIIPAIFAHLEYEQTNFSTPYIASNGSEILYERDWEPYMYIGLGYQSGNGIVGYEVSVYYNPIHDGQKTREVPWDFRIGFNYNF